MLPKNFSWYLLFAVVVLVLVFFAGVQYSKYYMAPEDPQIVRSETEENETEVEKNSEDKMIVHVAGAVFNEGIYELPPQSRINSAVEKAVPLSDADLSRLNLAEPIRDGQKITVPYKTDAKDVTIVENEQEDKVNINSAPAVELQKLPSIGPVISERIVQHRNDKGYFENTEELMDVSGIGESIYENVKEHITVY